MQRDPFGIFIPHRERLYVALFTKEDRIRSDQGRRAAEALDATDFASLQQAHGNTTVVVRAPSDRHIPADGLLTDTPGLALLTRSADCQSLVMYAPEKHIAGVLHAGWRGLDGGVIGGFFEVLKDTFAIDPEDTLVGIAPSLCAACACFTDPAHECANIDPRFYKGRCIDLRSAADRMLRDLGVLPENIERLPGCTRCEPDRYWTYRGGDREAVKGGQTNVLACVLA